MTPISMTPSTTTPAASALAVTIALMRADQCAAVRQLIVDGLTERWGTYDASLNLDIESFPSAYADSTTLVALRLGQVAGTGTLKPSRDGRAEIVRMSVARNSRRTGIGTLILCQLMNIARKRGMCEVTLETSSSWASAIEFYLGYGFRKTHESGGDTYFVYSLNP